MKEQGKKAVIFGSDGLDSGDFKIQGAYISAFAPDIRGIKGNAAFIKGYGKKFVSNFGPPMYVATQAAIMAIQKACADGNATRAEVQKNLRTTFIPKSTARRQPAVHRQGRRQGLRSSTSSSSAPAARRRWSASHRFTRRAARSFGGGPHGVFVRGSPPWIGTSSSSNS